MNLKHMSSVIRAALLKLRKRPTPESVADKAEVTPAPAADLAQDKTAAEPEDAKQVEASPAIASENAPSRPRSFKPSATLALTALLIVTGAGGAYWWRHQHNAGKQALSTSASADKRGEKNKKEKTRKLLYYRNPMGLPDTSPVPKKDSMGMDYVPVYEGEDDDATSGNQLRISTEKVQKLGVMTETVSKQDLARTIRAVGRVEVDERRVHVVTPRVNGWIVRLHANATGQAIKRGDALFQFYSPELNAAQNEYAVARKSLDAVKGAGRDTQSRMKTLIQASLVRLENLGVDEQDLAQLRKTGTVKRTFSMRAPVAGFVTEKKAVQGMRFGSGDTLYQITDLSSVWVVVDVPVQEIAQLKRGQSATVTFNAYAGKEFKAKVVYVYPTVNRSTQTAPVRLQLANKRGLLKPGMNADVDLSIGKGTVLAVPVSAVIDSGVRQIVLVEKGEGRFEPREVKLGERNDSNVAVLEGVSEGEKVVVSANFLLDAESNLRAAVSGFAKPGSAGADEPAGTAHHADGVIESVDPDTATLSITHEPVASLNWPAMTMEFKLRNAALMKTVSPGQKIAFDFIEQGPGEYVVTNLAAKDKSGPASKGKAGRKAAAGPRHKHSE